MWKMKDAYIYIYETNARAYLNAPSRPRLCREKRSGPLSTIALYSFSRYHTWPEAAQRGEKYIIILCTRGGQLNRIRNTTLVIIKTGAEKGVGGWVGG